MKRAARPTLKQLEYFAALADSRHYRKAAERVGISQPSLSLQIGNLEEVLGTKLVERGRSGAVLTPVGREVLDRANTILSEMADLVALTEQSADSLRGTFHLGSSATIGAYLLPSVLQRVRTQYPDLKLFIRDGAPQDLLQDLLSARHDMIVTQLPVASTDVVVVPLFREPLHLVVSREHRLADAKRVEDADLAGENLLSLSARFTLHQQITDLSREVGANLLQDFEGTSLDALRQMVAMNMGVSFLPALYVASEISGPDADVTVVPFRPGRFYRMIGLVWRKTAGGSPRFSEFGEIIRDVSRHRFRGLVQLANTG